MANEPQGGADATEFCTNCKRDIPSVNFLMHQNHCSRNIVLCSQCTEPVPRTEMENHKMEYHAEVTCKCGEAVEKWKKEEHDADQCPQRQVVCQFCEMEMDFKDLSEHTDFCGSRTDLCPRCKRYVAFKDSARHEASNCRLPEAKPARTNPEVAPATLRDHWQRNLLPHSLVGQRAFPRGAPDPFSLPLRLRAAEGPGEGQRAHNVAARPELMAAGRKHRKNQDRIQNVMTKLPSRGIEKNEERALLQSTANQEESDRHLAQHLAQDLPYNKPSTESDLCTVEAHLGYTAQSLGNFQDDFALQRILKETYSVPAVNTFQEQAVRSFEEVTLPCEFCQQPIPAESLIQHQSGCRPDLASLPIPETRANNQREQPHHHPQPPSDVLNNLSYESTYGQTLPGYSGIDRPASPITYDDDSMLMLPCEFCEVLLPSDALPMHQVNCVENRTVTPSPATFEPGSLPARRGGPTESPKRLTAQRVQRPQDFAVPARPRKFPDDNVYVDPSVDDDDDESDPVWLGQTSHRPAARQGQPTHSVSQARYQSNTNPPSSLPRSASEKYLNSNKRGPPTANPTTTAIGLPQGGAVPKPRTRNTARPEFQEERPLSKSEARVQETLQRLRDVPDEQGLNNAVMSAQPARQGFMSKPLNNGSHYKFKKKSLPAASFNLSGFAAEDDPLAAPPPPNPFLVAGKAGRQQGSAGARQKVRKPHGSNRDTAQHAGAYTPSFPGGAAPLRKGRDSERRGNGSATAPHKPKQGPALNAATLDTDALTSALKIKEETNKQKKGNRKPAARRQAVAKFHGDS